MNTPFVPQAMPAANGPPKVGDIVDGVVVEEANPKSIRMAEKVATQASSPPGREWKTVAGVQVKDSTVEEMARKRGLPEGAFEPKYTGIPNHCAVVVG